MPAPDVSPIRIESADDERVADFVGLRDRTGASRKAASDFFVAESELVVRRLFTSPFKVRSVLVSPARHEAMKDVIAALRVPVYLAEQEVMRSIAGYDVHRGVLASARRGPNRTLPDLAVRATRLLVLEGVNDAENLGAVARSARALGFHGLVLDPACADPYSRRAIRVSMGEVLHLPVVRCTKWPDPLDYLNRVGFETWGLTPADEAVSLYEMGMPTKLALVAGAEGRGLTQAARARTQVEVRIPMHFAVDSLNIGHALAIAMAATSPPVGGC
ncbi:MAG: RNA methyltransferase [Actinobacteria bacterium]|nr:RNA methyltransferase [Actinomycetota bacterium]